MRRYGNKSIVKQLESPSHDLRVKHCNMYQNLSDADKKELDDLYGLFPVSYEEYNPEE